MAEKLLTISISEMSYALIAGYDVDDQKYCPKMEMMYENGTTKMCHFYPEYVFWISGGSFLKNNLIVACGGGRPPTSACYSMTNNFKWANVANLTTPKMDTASVIVKNGLWVTGKGNMFSVIKHSK